MRGARAWNERAAAQEVARALQLSPRAEQSIEGLSGQLGDRPAALRECVVVTGAADLLAEVSLERWREWMDELSARPRCMGAAGARSCS